MFLQAWFLPNTPQIKGGMGRKSTTLFDENLSLICCSCRGPFGQLNRAGFGSFPNEATTCYTWIGHLRGTWVTGASGCHFLSGQHEASKEEKKCVFYLSHVLSCSIKRSNGIQSELERLTWCDAVQDLGMIAVWVICLALRCHYLISLSLLQ